MRRKQEPIDWVLLYRWLKAENYISTLAEFRHLTLAQLNLFIQKSKEVEAWKKKTEELNKALRR